MYDRPHPYPALHLLSLLASGDTINARYLYLRTPTSSRDSDPDFQAAWKAGSSLWTKQWANVYTSLKGHTFSERLHGLVEKVIENTRESVAGLIEKGYEVGEVGRVKKMMGMESVEEIKSYCRRVGRDWVVEDEGFLRPRESKVEMNGVRGDGDSDQSLQRLNKLAEQLVRLHTS